MKTSIYVTDLKNKKLLEKNSIESLQVERYGGWGIICVFPEEKYQKVQGFGGAFTDSAASVFEKLPKNVQDDFLEAYFDTEKGNAYNFCRVHIASCDFSPYEYTHIAEGDTELKSFSIAEDKKRIIPMLKAAQKYGEITLFASPWSPPAFMKDNGSRFMGGKLMPEFYGVWTEYVARFIEEYRKLGIEIAAVTVQNEAEAKMTWESCNYTPQEECALIKSGFGKRMQELGVKIYVWDHNKERSFDRARTVYEDTEASQYVAGVALHWYTGDHFEQLDMLKRKYPEKEIIFSEGCCAASHSGALTEDEGLAFAERYAHEIIGDFKGGLSGFCDWNLTLDTNNGPFHNRDGRKLYCAAPVLSDIENGRIIKELSYYYIGQFSRFIQKNALRIACSSYTDKLETVAFENPDGSIVVVILNRTDEDQKANVILKGEKLEYVSPAHSISTIVA